MAPPSSQNNNNATVNLEWIRSFITVAIPNFSKDKGNSEYQPVEPIPDFDLPIQPTDDPGKDPEAPPYPEKNRTPPPKSRLVGLPYTTVSVREPIIDMEKSKFVYNFYTPDERLGKEERGLTLTSDDFVTRQEVLDANIDLRGIPMLNHVVFKHNPDLYASALQKELGFFVAAGMGSKNLINKFKQNAINTSGELILRPDRIIAEGTFANKFYKSATLLETSLDSKVYTAFNEQLKFFEMLESESMSAKQLNEVEYNDRIDAYFNREDAKPDYQNADLVRNFIDLSRSWHRN